MKMRDAAVIGEIYIDHIFGGFEAWPQPGEEVFTREYAHEIGGGAANTACALARLGRSVSLIGVVGAEDAGWLSRRLGEFGVSGEGLRSTGGKTGVTVSVSTRQDRTFFTYVGENVKVVQQLGEEAVFQSLTEARHVHFAMPLPIELARILLPRLRSAGCTTSLDVGCHAEWLRAPAMFEICRLADFLLPNEHEAALVTGRSADEYLDLLRANGVDRGVVKLGARGAVMIDGGTSFQASSPVVEVVDTTGAGDAFDAGFIDGLLDGADPQVCLRRACLCGALSTRVAGALSGLPRREEVESWYEQTYAT